MSEEQKSDFQVAMLEYRVQNNLSQMQLGEKWGVTGALISHYERGIRVPLAARAMWILKEIRVPYRRLHPNFFGSNHT